MAGTATTPASATDTNPAVLSPQEMNDGQLQEFLAKGTRFERGADDLPADNTADSATAEHAEHAASTDASHETASETVKPEKTKKGKGIEARNADLRAEIEENARLLRQRKEQRDALTKPDPAPKTDAKTDSSTTAAATPTEDDVDRFANHPDFPDPEKYSDLKKWGAAVSRFVAKEIAKESFTEMFAAERGKQTAADDQTREWNEAVSKAEERATVDEARHPNWREQVDPAFAAIPPMRALPEGAKPHAMHFVKDQVMFESENPVSLTLFLCTDEGKQWAAKLVTMPPQRIVREIAIKDASFASGDDDATPNPSHVSAAPAPGHTLGRKTTAPVDPLKTAVATGDVEAFINTRNKSQVGKR